MTALRNRDFSGRYSGIGLIAMITIVSAVVVVLAYMGRAK